MGMHMNKRWILALLAAACWLGTASAANPEPTAFHAHVMPLTKVDSISLPALDRAAIAAEDDADAGRGEPPRYAIPRKVNITPDKDGTWESVDAHTKIWRFLVKTPDATSLNLGFTQFFLPQGSSLLLYSADGKRTRGPFTDADNRAYKELWTPVILSPEIVVELTIPSAAIPKLELAIGQIGQGYRGFGAPGDKSGSCNMDVACIAAADPWQNNVRAVAVISTGGSRFCSGSLINDTAGDTKMYFMTAHHCSVAGTAASLVTYWNYQNSICRVPGTTASGAAGDGSLAQFNTGATLRADNAPSDFTLVEMTQAPNPAFNLFWAGWDHTPYSGSGGPGNGDFACTPDSLCAGIHHPNTDEKRITFVADNTTTTSYNNPAVPGDGTHVHAFWDPTPVFPPDPNVTIPPQVTEPGSSGSPLYNAQRRYIGQLHGGPSACGSTGGNLSDYYGRFSVSWEGGGSAATRLKDWLDAGNTGALAIDGRNQCTAPPVPGNLVATANGNNRIDLTWDAATGANSYKVYRGDGACPGTNWQLIADNVATTAYSDTAVSGSATYSYAVTSFSTAQTCESAHSGCSAATATGVCTLSPTFAGLTSASSSANQTCGVDLGWSAGTNNCASGGALKYNIFRSTTAGFTPSAGNRIANCQTGTSYHDGSVVNGTQYYYIARAEDDTSNGSGSCNSGNEDANTVQKSATPAGPPTVAFSDDMESGTTNWTVAGTGAGSNFAQVTTDSHSPTHSWFSPDPNAVGDHTIASASAIAVGPGATLEFWHHYNSESTYDGAVLEYSLDGTTWVDILAASGSIPANANRFTEGAYNATISTQFMSPISGRRAWSGDSAAFVHVAVDLADFGGQNVWFRWRFASDQSVASTGYWLDDVTIAAGTTCNFVDVIFADGFESPVP
jgi:lysyl endopeptidase